MKNWYSFTSKLLFLLLLLFLPSLTNVSQYIWINYGQVQLTEFDQTTMLMKFPCETRIGQCTYNYKQIPWGWFALSNGNLLIPKNDIQIDKSFSIEVTVSEPTGESIDASLIADFNNGNMNILQKNQFYSSLSYQPSYTSVLPPRTNLTKNSTSDTVKTSQPTNSSTNNQPTSTVSEVGSAQTAPSAQVPPGIFPPFKEVQTILNSGDTLKIVTTISNILSIESDCLIKLRYLKQIQTELQIIIIRNQGSVQLANNKIKEIESEIAKLNAQKNIVTNQGSSKTSENYSAEIANLENMKKDAQMEQQKNEKIANNYLLAIKRNAQQKSAPEIINKTQIQPISYEFEEQELVAVNAALEELVKRKNELELSIASKKIEITIRELQNPSKEIENLEAKYKEYSGLAVMAKIEAQNLDYEIRNLKNKVDQYKKSVADIEAIISAKEQELASKTTVEDGRKITEVRNLIQTLTTNQAKFQTAIGQLNQECPQRF